MVENRKTRKIMAALLEGKTRGKSRNNHIDSIEAIERKEMSDRD